MSGIAAIYRQNNLVDLGLLDDMLNVMAYRGPDARETWTGQKIGLGSCLLRATPESLLETPVTKDPKNNYHLVWDGRIDNRSELLALTGINKEATDPEILLAVYEKKGVECLSEIIGDFAFALWDGSKELLFCGRDRVGLKTLHYAWDGKDLSLSTEAKPLFNALGGIPAPDDQMVMAFLAYRNFTEQEQDRSFFSGIKRLPPAHFLTLQGGKLEINRYWDWDLSKTLRLADEKEYVSRFKEIFNEAVRCRLRSNTPISLSLSGGLDSSAIACSASDTLKKENGTVSSLEAWNFYSDHASSDERPFAREVAQKTGLVLREFFSRTQDPLPSLEKYLWDLEAPFMNTSSNREPYEMLRDRGCRVLLTGDGGDQVLDEYGFPSDLLQKLKLISFAKKTSSFSGQFASLGSAPSRFPLLFLKEALSNILPQPLLNLRQRLTKNAPPAWLNQTLTKKLGLRKRFFTKRLTRPGTSFVQRETHWDVTRPYSVMKWEAEERIHGLYGVELRCPFLDSRLIEFILALPSDLRAKGERKDILKKALRGSVPDLILSRKDKGDHTEQTDSVLLKLCSGSRPEPLADHSGKMNRYVQLPLAGKMLRQFLQGKDVYRFDVWFLITMDRWLKKFNKGVSDEKQSGQEALQQAPTR